MRRQACLLCISLALAGPPVVRAGDGRPLELAGLSRSAVEDHRGNAVGVVSDFVIDMHDRVVAFALVAPGPGAPAQACRIAAGGLSLGRDGLRLPGETRTLDAVPSCSATGWTRGEASEAPRYVRASELRGSAVTDRDGNTVGIVRDIVVEADSARVRHALAHPIPAEADQSLMAVPLGPVRKVDGRLLMASAAALGRTSPPAAAR